LSELDPVSYEVIRNRLVAISDEMRVALQSVSGSPTVVEASDFFTGLFRADGSYVAMGFQGTFASAPLSRLVQWLLAEEATTIEPGDMFVNNDPWIGALHQNDVEMVCPIFAGDELVAWAGVMAHETDVGGMDFASWSPKAREVYQEGLLIPAVKLVEKGVMREDVLRMVLASSRLPEQLGLDLRAFTATLHVAGERVGALTRRYGPLLDVAMERMVASTHRQLGQRLLELPDGEFRATDYIEHDGHEDRLYGIDLWLTKEADQLRLDFTGSSDQAPGFINCTEHGLEGAVVGTILPTLAWDMPWNEGAMRGVEIVSRPGSVVTAQHPAPVGAATVSAVWVTSSVVTSALNKLLAAAPKYHHRAQGVSCGTMATLNMGGRNQRGEFFGFHSLDSLACGSGAYASRDGIDAGGPYHGPRPSIADVERNEEVTPMRTLYRRLAPDTGGHGRMRGGVSAEVAFTIGGVDRVDVLIMTHGLEVPNATGLLGGAPGSQVRQRIGRDALPDGAFGSLPRGADPAVLGGDWEELGPKPGMMPLRKEDVVALRWQGGGGMGDPLDREATAVWQDVERGVLSAAAARAVYGVVVGPAGPVYQATREERARIRELRIGRPALDPVDVPGDAAVLPFGDALELVVEGGTPSIRCRGHVLVSGTTCWRSAAVKQRFAMPADNPPLHPDLQMTAFFCPHTATLLAIDVHRAGEEPADDAVLELGSLERLLSTETISA
jgi:N-methylhydantoinase B